MLLQRICPFLLLWLGLPVPGRAQPSDEARVIRLVDAAVQSRVENVLAFTDIEHYAVYRGKDQTHPVAEMTVRDTYTKGSGKTYTILSQSGSSIVQKLGLQPLLENETRINQPANVASSWFTSANFAMKLQAGGPRQLNGRACYVLAIAPRQKAPNLIQGAIWVDAADGSLAQVDGVASKSPSIFAGTTRMMRTYRNIDGFAMAVHARAESSSFLFGHTVVLIDYGDYRLQMRNHGRLPPAIPQP
ncbi:MAG: hypothetical protein ACLGP3_09155 [Acidobacteriota bacterium]